jgi:hypothetical protein
MTAAALIIIFGLICFFVVIPHDLKKEVDNSQLADLQYWSGFTPKFEH